MAVPGAMSSEEEFLVFAIKPEVFTQNVADETNPDFQNPAAICDEDDEPNVLPTPGMLGVLGMRLIMYLEISEKRYPQAGFNYFNSGFGVATMGTTAKSANLGLPSQEAVRTSVIPTHIGGTEKFRLTLFNPDGVPLEVGYNLEDASCSITTFADVRVYLDGLYRRGTA
jgi:hypothetical protein